MCSNKSFLKLKILSKLFSKFSVEAILLKSQEKHFFTAVIDYLNTVIDYHKFFCEGNRLPKRCNRLHHLNF